MAKNEQPQNVPWRAEDSPTAWFCVLERARQTHDFHRADEAQRELARLGVKVKYTRAEREASDAR